jgi:CRISPR-associated protein Cas2
MHYLVSYDISDDRQRLKASKILDDYGDRVQESVFELVNLSDGIWQKCLQRLKSKVELGGQDSIRVYVLCETCRGKILMLGRGEKPMDEPDVYVV